MSLPAASEDPSTDAERRQSARTEAADSLRILLVDDNEDAAAMLGIYLGKLGHVIHIAHDGLEALDAATEFGPEVALLDIGLPVMDGYELARRLHQAPGVGPLMLVALTGYGQESDHERSREAGFDLHLVKPVDRARLELALQKFAVDRVPATRRGPR